MKIGISIEITPKDLEIITKTIIMAKADKIDKKLQRFEDKVIRMIKNARK